MPGITNNAQIGDTVHLYIANHTCHPLMVLDASNDMTTISGQRMDVLTLGGLTVLNGVGFDPGGNDEEHLYDPWPANGSGAAPDTNTYHARGSCCNVLAS